MKNLKASILAKGAVITAALSAGFMALSAKADYSTSTLATAFSTTLNGMVQSIITTIVTFFTDNAPLIVILGAAISLVWYFVAKAKGASRGR